MIIPYDWQRHMDDDDVVSFGESRKQHVVESSLLISDKEAYPGTPFHSVGISPTLSEILRLDYNMLLPLFSSRIHSYHIHMSGSAFCVRCSYHHS